MNQAKHHQQQSSAAIMGNDAGQPVTITLPPSSTAYEMYKSRQSKIAGLILIVVGAVSLGIGIGLLMSKIRSAPGLGTGILLIITGSFGIASARKSRCLVVTFLVFAILSATSAGGMLILSASVVIVYFRNEGYHVDYHHMEPANGFNVVIACVILAIMAVIAEAITIWSSVLGCKVACCGRPAPTVVNGYISIPQDDPSAGAPPAYVSAVDAPVMLKMNTMTAAKI